MAQSICITGSTDGIGKLVAQDLAKQDKTAAILLHGRDKNKLDAVVAETMSKSGNLNVEGFTADFSSLDQVRRFAKDVLSKYNGINILINNAGAGFAAPRYGKNGTETRFTVNYLAPFLLTNLLLPALKNATPSRIVNVASAGQSAIHFADVMLEKHFDGIAAYTQSKLALVMFTFDLAAQLKENNITVNALHPGTYLDTNMVHEAGIKPLGSAQSGADAIIYLATSAELKNITGKYFNVKNEAKAHTQAYDANARKQLREITLMLTGL
jgi:NAD(P)-dependent dehydrogenase (short-subunit alcohol dehydrogenase family)